jgi:YidC/Oxa1 family membrane protein insertase
MLNFLYTIIIFPIVQLIELCFVFTYRVFHNSGMAIFGVSIAVSVFTLPLYLIADKFQKKEQELQNKMKPKIDRIKAVFKGDEQYMILSTFYKQNHYHPVFALRNTVNLLIQIPFFIAAYSYLSRLQILKGASFFFITDLGAPDVLFSFQNIRLNVLPIIMTLINITSSAVYTKNFSVKDKIQLYGIAIIFLILLYNSPAGLVIYWTVNNIFSLAKNLLQNAENPKKIFLYILFPVILILDIFLLFFHRGDLPNRLLAAVIVSSAILPFILKKKKPILNIQPNNKINSVFQIEGTFILSCVIIFLLCGFVIPSSLIASSVEDFSYIGSRTSPFPYLFQTLKQSAGIFLFWPFVVYILCSVKTRRNITYIFFIAAEIVLVNVFLIFENFGFFTTTMKFSEPKTFSLIPLTYFINIVIFLLFAAILFLLVFHHKKMLITSLQIITLISLFGFCLLNIKRINNDFSYIKNNRTEQQRGNNIFNPEYIFSRTGKNVLLILLDSAIGSYIPYILEENPKINSILDGFHWYPNSVSFANHTLIGALPIYGGYEYTPFAINSKKDISLLTKQQEAYLLLPKIFYDLGYSVTVTDPPFDNYKMSNMSIFQDNPEFNAKNLTGKYTMQWLREHQEISTLDINEYLDNNLIRFSFFKCSPLFLRLFIYDDGKWLKLDNGSNQLTEFFIDDYAFMDTLYKITSFTEAANTYTSLYAHIAHNSVILQVPDYLPVLNVTDKGSGPLANDGRFHAMMSSLLLLGKWFEYLKENGVYDNTRIIIAADHGRSSSTVPENITLPDGGKLFNYNALLMIKDFNAHGGLSESDTFMTNADVPLLALAGLVDNPVNPYTAVQLQSDKDNGVMITTIDALSSYRHLKNTFNIGSNQWLHVNDNIFDPANWKTMNK